MKRAAIAGLAYFAVIFTTGFLLGSIRVLALAPALGELGAVLIELPVILLACWWVSGFMTRRLLASHTQAAALIMGGVAFACLMIAEFTLAGLAFDRSPADQIARWATLGGALGLIGQIAFALFPWIQVRRPAFN